MEKENQKEKNVDNEKEKVQKQEGNKKKKFTIAMKFKSVDFVFFSELEGIKRLNGVDFNKVIIFLVILFLRKFLEIKSSDELKKFNISDQQLKDLRKMFLDFESDKVEINDKWEKTTVENYALKTFKKRINVNLYADKDEDCFILLVVSKLHKSIIENDKVEIEKFVSKSIYFFILEGMKEFYKSKLDIVMNINS